jgi:chemotaxis protein methyltransferase CheR
MTAIKDQAPARPTTRRIGDLEFERIRHLMREQVGIVLQENKKALVEARVNRRLRTLGVDSYAAYIEYLDNDRSGAELALLIDAISTNVTQFFREIEHFHFLERTVAQWLACGRSRLRFWSAACSSGEEPYSMAMVLRRLEGAADADLKILATDINTAVLRDAQRGNYSAASVESIPATYVEGVFQRRTVEGETRFRVHDSLKQMVLFRRMNLNRMPYPIRGRFDVIFIRNVMIYFDRELRGRIVEQAHGLLNDDGILIVGHAETLIGMDSQFSYVQPSVYRKV